MNHYRVLPWMCFLLLTAPARSEVKLDPAFGDNMVLQRNTQPWLSGTTAPGPNNKVWVRCVKEGHGFLGLGSDPLLGTTTVSASGAWELWLDFSKCEVSGPFTLRISAGTSEGRDKHPTHVRNVALGDVYLVAEPPGQGHRAEPREIAASAPERLRFLDLTTTNDARFSWVVFDDSDHWDRFSILAVRLAHKLSSYEGGWVGMVLVTTNELAVGLKGERRVIERTQAQCSSIWSWINEPILREQREIEQARIAAQMKHIYTNIPWVVEYAPPAAYYMPRPSDFPTARLSAVSAIWPQPPASRGEEH